MHSICSRAVRQTAAFVAVSSCNHYRAPKLASNYSTFVVPREPSAWGHHVQPRNRNEPLPASPRRSATKRHLGFLFCVESISVVARRALAPREVMTMQTGNQSIGATEVSWWGRLVCLLEALFWVPPLLVCLFVGYFFFQTVWASSTICPLSSNTFRNEEFPIPASTPPCRSIQGLGGALTIAGLATCFVSVAMVINMIVAVVRVKLNNVSELDALVESDEPLYALLYVWLEFTGATPVSLDCLISAAVGIRPSTSSYALSAPASATVAPRRN